MIAYLKTYSTDPDKPSPSNVTLSLRDMATGRPLAYPPDEVTERDNSDSAFVYHLSCIGWSLLSVTVWYRENTRSEPAGLLYYFVRSGEMNA